MKKVKLGEYTTGILLNPGPCSAYILNILERFCHNDIDLKLFTSNIHFLTLL